MTARSPFTGKISAARTGLILLFLLAVWLAFAAMPSRKAAAAKIPHEYFPVTKLNAVGLPDNPDWGGLPEIFAIWADKAEWKDGRTRFAYWHPVMKTYSYYFEAVRVEGKFHFREIAEPREPDFYWDESLGNDCPIRFYYPYPSVARSPRSVSIDPVADNRTKLEVDVTAPGIKVPPVDPSLINSQPKH